MISSAQLFGISASPKLTFLNQNRTIILELFLSVACGLTSPVCSDIVPWYLFLASWRIHGIYGNILALLLESVNSLKSLPSAPSTTAPCPVESLPSPDLSSLGKAEASARPGRVQCLLISLPGTGLTHHHLEPLANLCSSSLTRKVYFWASDGSFPSPYIPMGIPMSQVTNKEGFTAPGRSHGPRVPYPLLSQSFQDDWLSAPSAKPHSHQQMCLLLGAKGICLKGKEILEGTIW